MLKYYFPFYFQLEEPRKIGFGGVPLKQHIRENARKLVKTGAKRALDFFSHAHILCWGGLAYFEAVSK